MQFTRCTAVTADGTLWAWGSDRPAMLRDGLVDPEDPYDTEACDGIVRITNGVVCAVPCSDRTLAVLADGSLWQFPAPGFSRSGRRHRTGAPLRRKSCWTRSGCPPRPRPGQRMPRRLLC